MTPEVVSFPSDGHTLHGVLFKPEADGPFVVDAIDAAQASVARDALPVLLGATVALIAAVLILMRRRRWWLRSVSLAIVCFLAVGVFARVFANARGEATIQVLATDHLDDHLAAYEWLRTQRFADPRRIATGGNSFGGIVTVLGAERVAYCAAVDGAGGAQTWTTMRAVRERMVHAVRDAKAPTFFFQAENDYSVEPSRVSSAEMQRAGKPFETKIYPAFGSSPDEGHSFAYRGSAVWSGDVFRFLDEHCGR